MMPSPNFWTGIGTMPTRAPPITAPTTDPAPIGATVSANGRRSANNLRLAYRTSPTVTVGSEIAQAQRLDHDRPIGGLDSLTAAQRPPQDRHDRHPDQHQQQCSARHGEHGSGRGRGHRPRPLRRSPRRRPVGLHVRHRRPL